MRAGRNAGGSAPVRIVRSCAWRLLAPRGRFVRTVERSADRDELETVGARDRQAGGCWIDANEATGVELDLLTIDAHRAAALHDEVDLFEVRIAVVVLASFLVRREDEVVETERL